MPAILGEPNWNLIVYVTPPTPVGQCNVAGCTGGCNHADPRINDDRVVFNTWCTVERIEELDDKYPGAKALIKQLRALIQLRATQPLEEQESTEHWICWHCKSANQGKICTACGKLKPKERANGK